MRQAPMRTASTSTSSSPHRNDALPPTLFAGKMTMKQISLLLLALCALAAGVAPSAAQEPSPPADTTSRQTALSQLSPGKPLLLTLDTETRLRGMLLRVSGDTLVLKQRHLEQDIPLALIDTIRVPDYQIRSRAALGGVIGAIGLALWGQTVVRGLCDSPGGCTADSQKVLLGSVVVGGAGGALIGAGVGALFPGWKQLYPR